jgi:tetratricopeptide (TPR) repeat protein
MRVRSLGQLWYYRPVRVLTALILAVLVVPLPLAAADPLAEARRLYNSGQFDAAEQLALEAIKAPGMAEGARLVLGRIHLERFRRNANPAELAAGREALRAVDARALDPRDHVELTIGLGEALFLDDRFGPAAEIFQRALDRSSLLGPVAHERLLDWWATALDRMAQGQPKELRQETYRRVLTRMEEELAIDPGLGAAAYWLTAAARGLGDLERAWHAAAAAWVGAVLARDRGAALRADIDRLVVQAIIPERAARLQVRDSKPAAAGMLAEWQAFKSSWSR